MMNRAKICLSLVAILLLMSMILSGCSKNSPPPMYSAHTMEGVVVDKRTHEPLRGVVVTANWELVGDNNEATTQLTVLESVTNELGRFYFPAWGPKPRTEGKRLSASAPHVVVFKSGYAFKEFRHEAKVGADGKLVSPVLSIELELFFDRNVKSDLELFFEFNVNPDAPWYFRALQTMGNSLASALRWAAEFLPLGDRSAKLRTDVAAYAKHLGGLQTALAWAYEGKQCEWKQVAGMMTAVHRQAGEFRRLGIESDLKLVDIFISPQGAPDPCGAREYFEAYPIRTLLLFEPVPPTKLINMGGASLHSNPNFVGRKE